MSGSWGRKKIKVAFLNLGSSQWAGGLHYLRNLLYAISVLEDRRIEPYVFVGAGVDERLVEPVRPYARIVRTPLVERRKSLSWFGWKAFFLLAGSNWPLNRLMRRHGIEVVSHSNIWGRGLPYKLINWIPDFQHLRLPEMFSEKERADRSRDFRRLLRDSDRIVLSSKDAETDLCEFFPGNEAKVRVLNFVSQPSVSSWDSEDVSLAAVEGRCSFKGKFFYMPNQFWRHKNHRVVFEAVNILKDRGVDIQVVCSGYMDDYRHKEHVGELRAYIRDNGLGNNIRLLGMIDYRDVFVLMRHAVAVINPSLFEGWSSTVEEAKSMGKGMILSDIPVHREQNPPGSVYFPPRDPNKLAALLESYWLEKEGGPDLELERRARELLPERTRAFGRRYQEIVLEMFA